MRSDLEHIAWIEKYLENKLSPEDRLIFEERLTSDNDFMAEVEFQRNVQQRIERLALVSLIQNQHVSYVSGGKSNWWNLNNVLWLTGVMLVTCLTAYLIINSSDEVEHRSKLQSELISIESSVDNISVGSEYEKDDYVEIEADLSQETEEAYSVPQDTSPVVVAVRIKYDSDSEKIQSLSYKPNDEIIESKKNKKGLSTTNFVKPFETFSLRVNEGGIFTTKSGTQITVPPKAVIRPNGKLAVRPATLYYREYRDPADMMFANINMFYHNQHPFHSHGMFEIYVYDGIDSLRAVKPFKVTLSQADYHINTGYFKYVGNDWIQLNIETGDGFPDSNSIRPYTRIDHGNGVVELKADLKEKEGFEYYFISESEDALKNMKKITVRDGKMSWYWIDTTWGGITHFLYLDVIVRKIQHPYKNWNGNIGSWEYTDQGYFRLKCRNCEEQDSLKYDFSQGFDVAESDGSGGVQLPVNQLGIYNCDDVRRFENEINIDARFVDSDGKAIRNFKQCYLVDPNLNAAYTYPGGNFRCDSKSDNKVVILTDDGHLYGLKSCWLEQNIDRSGRYTIMMVEISNEVHNIETLRTYLNQRLPSGILMEKR